MNDTKMEWESVRNDNHLHGHADTGNEKSSPISHKQKHLPMTQCNKSHTPTKSVM